MYQPLETIGEKAISKPVAFEKSIIGSVLRIIREDVYVQGEHGWFRVGRVIGGSQIEIGFDRMVEKYRKLIEDMVRLTGSFTVAKRVPADWLR